MTHLGRVLLVALVAGVLAACGGSGSATDTTGSQPSVAASMEASVAASVEASATAGGEQATAAGGALPDLGGRAVVVGTDATYPPMESVDRDTNQIVGFDVDLMNEIAQLINIKPEFQNADFSTIFEALQNKQFDAVMSSATITEERQQMVNFSDPYIEVGQVVVTTADNAQITGAESLRNGAIVGVQTGTTGEEAALSEAQVPDSNLKRYQTIDLAFADLANNSIDALVADSPTVANYTTQPQYQNRVKVVGEAFTTEQYGIAVPKDDSELLAAINAALEQLKQNGTIDRLKEKYDIK